MLKKKQFNILSAILLAYFFAVFFSLVRYIPLNYDPAIHAILAKNVSNGYGWALSYHGRDLFMGFTTGPTTIFPGALIIALLGNAIWVPAFSAVFICSILFSVVIYLLSLLLTNKQHFFYVLLAFCFTFIFYKNEFWLYFLGDTHSFLLFLVASLYYLVERKNIITLPVSGGSEINRVRLEKRVFFVLGVMIALSLNAKMMVLPAIAGLLLFILTDCFGRGGFIKTWKGIYVRVFWGLLGFISVMIPYHIFEAWQFYQSPNDTYLAYLVERREFLQSKSSSGITAILNSNNIFWAVIENIIHQFGVINSTLKKHGLNGVVLLVSLSLSIFYAIKSLKRKQDNLDLLISVMFFAFVFNAIWYFLVANVIYDRHSLQFVWLGFLLFFFVFLRQFKFIGLLGLMISLLLLSSSDKKNDFFQALTLSNPYGEKTLLMNELTSEITEYIGLHDMPSPLANCGWMGATRAVEFLLPESGNFQDCYKLIDEALIEAPEPNSGNKFQWKYPVNFTLLINKLTWRMAKSLSYNRKRHTILMKACKENIIYENDLYRLSECRFEELQKTIPLDEYTPFVDAPPWWVKVPIDDPHLR